MLSQPISNDEILPARAELHQLDDVSREINDKQVALFRRLNALQSATGVLPPEILSLIFQHACPSDFAYTKYSPRFPVWLGSVSHAWRRVTWSTPQLWTTLILNIPSAKAAKFAELLDLYLTNVRGCPISLAIEFDSHGARNFEEDPVAQVFFKKENLKKLGDLELHQPPIGWLRHFSGPLPQLTAIHLADGDDSSLLENTTFLVNAPRLREISLVRTQPPPSATWSSITILKLQYISFVVAFRCLLESPNLVVFHYYSGGNSSEEEQEELLRTTGDLTLRHLEILSWSFVCAYISDFFLRRIRLPVLRSLTWAQPQWDMDFIYPCSSGVRTFLQNLSSAPLTTLCLSEMLSLNSSLVKDLYRQNPQIEHFILECCNKETIQVALSLLTLGWDGKGKADERRYLTKLKMLVIRGYQLRGGGYVYPAIKNLDLGDIIAELLIGRVNGGFNSSFCVDLYLAGWVEMEWRSDTKKRLQEFGHTGKGVQLLEYGKQVDWL